MESTYKLDEILLKPFHLTKKHHIPNDICEKLLPNGFCMLISWFDQDPDADRASSSLKRKNPPPQADPSGGSEVNPPVSYPS